jgi:predicted Zn finger-like uncharacterized protein
MLIQCEQCKIKYIVSFTKIGEQGRAVKCAKCSHVWFVKPTEEDIQISKDVEISSVEFPTNNTLGISLPAIIKKKKRTPLFTYTSIALLALCLMIIGYYNKGHINIDSMLYKSLFEFSTQDVTLDDISINKIGSTIIINGFIKNDSDKERILPYLRILILDKNGNVLFSHMTEINNQNLQPGEKYNIHNIIKNIHPWAEYLILDVGNKLELLIR